MMLKGARQSRYQREDLMYISSKKLSDSICGRRKAWPAYTTNIGAASKPAPGFWQRDGCGKWTRPPPGIDSITYKC
jgi:hypothetical protein